MPISFTFPAQRPDVHGHRGCRGLRPENTIPAFLHAVQLGVDVLELDVVVSADGQLVVSHEPWMNAAICLDPQGHRIAPAEQHQHNLYQLPYAAIRRYDCGQSGHPGFPEQQAGPAYKPLLREVVTEADALTQALGHAPMRYSIEVKSTAAGDDMWHPTPAVFIEMVLAQLRQLGVVQRTTLLSFDKRVLREARRQLPDLPLCLLVEDTVSLSEHLTKLGFLPQMYGPHHALVDEMLVAQTNRLRLQLVPWTVNEPADMLRLMQLGVNGLTSDYPDRLLHLLASEPGA